MPARRRRYNEREQLLWDAANRDDQRGEGQTATGAIRNDM